jgi:hypothetical protein
MAGPRWTSAPNTKSAQLTTANTLVANVAANLATVFTPGSSGGLLDKIVVVPQTTISAVVILRIWLNRSGTLRLLESRQIDTWTFSNVSLPPAYSIPLDLDLESGDNIDVNIMSSGASPGTLDVTALGGDY